MWLWRQISRADCTLVGNSQVMTETLRRYVSVQPVCHPSTPSAAETWRLKVNGNTAFCYHTALRAWTKHSGFVSFYLHYILSRMRSPVCLGSPLVSCDHWLLSCCNCLGLWADFGHNTCQNCEMGFLSFWCSRHAVSGYLWSQNQDEGRLWTALTVQQRITAWELQPKISSCLVILFQGGPRITQCVGDLKLNSKI